MLKQFCFIIILLLANLELVGIFDSLLMTFPVRFQVPGILKLILIIANFQCMLFLAAATHSFITKLA